LILWRVASLDAGIASIRYRGVLPATYLARLGYRSGFATGKDALPSRHLHAVVFVKAFSEADLACARAARQRGVPVILDLCDNIFVPGYRPTEASTEVLEEMAALSSVIVVTTSPLATEVERAIHPRVPIRLIPDPMETAQEQRDAAAALAQMRNDWRVWDAAQAMSLAWQRKALFQAARGVWTWGW
jgi:hypothetical protein